MNRVRPRDRSRRNRRRMQRRRRQTERRDRPQYVPARTRTPARAGIHKPVRHGWHGEFHPGGIRDAAGERTRPARWARKQRCDVPRGGNVEREQRISAGAAHVDVPNDRAVRTVAGNRRRRPIAAERRRGDKIRRRRDARTRRRGPRGKVCDRETQFMCAGKPNVKLAIIVRR